MGRHVVGTISEITHGMRKIVQIEGRSIGVFNIEGQLDALRNTCPHQGAPLCEGVVTPLVVSPAPTYFDYEREGEIVRCPWHQWEFDIKTGCMIVDKRMRTKSYEVTVEKFDIITENEQIVVTI
jgi:nitrite reductase (NADH) small subunit